MLVAINSPSRPNFISGSSVFMVSIEVVVVTPWWPSVFTFNESMEIERRENYNCESSQKLALPLSSRFTFKETLRQETLNYPFLKLISQKNPYDWR